MDRRRPNSEARRVERRYRYPQRADVSEADTAGNRSAAPFGEVRHYAAGEALFVTGEIALGMYVLIKGSVRVTRRDPLGHSAPIVEEGSGQPAFVDVQESTMWKRC